MLRFESKNHSGENRKAVLGSGIIAKAVLCQLPQTGTQSADGGYRYTVIVVFRKSTRLEFYWVFRAKSLNSSRRSWKLQGYYPRDFAFAQKPYRDFGSFVHYHAEGQRLRVLTERRTHKHLLSQLLVKTAHDSILANWEPQNPHMIVTDRCRRIAQRARSSRMVW